MDKRLKSILTHIANRIEWWIDFIMLFNVMTILFEWWLTDKTLWQSFKRIHKMSPSEILEEIDL